MTIKIRLARGGSKKRPFYKVVAADSRMPRDGRFLEKLGTYNPLLPKDHPDRVKLNAEKIQEWMGKGAQLSDRISRMLESLAVIPVKSRNNPKKGMKHKGTEERETAKSQKNTTSTEQAKSEDQNEQIESTSTSKQTLDENHGGTDVEEATLNEMKESEPNKTPEVKPETAEKEAEKQNEGKESETEPSVGEPKDEKEAEKKQKSTVENPESVISNHVDESTSNETPEKPKD